MTKAAQKVRAKRARRPLYLRCAKVADVDTGEIQKGWLALTRWDAKIMQERGYHLGTEARAIFQKSRNVKFHRLAHAMAALVAEQIEDFHGMTGHAALKRLQVESGALCEMMVMDASPVLEAVMAALRAIGVAEVDCVRVEGCLTALETISVRVPQSLAFDDMEAGEFEEMMKSIYRHIAAKYWTDMDEAAIEQMVEMFEGGAHA